MAIGRTEWGPKVPTLKGTELSLSCVQCFLYPASSSGNASIFSYSMAGYLWTELIGVTVKTGYFEDTNLSLTSGW